MQVYMPAGHKAAPLTNNLRMHEHQKGVLDIA